VTGYAAEPADESERAFTRGSERGTKRALRAQFRAERRERAPLRDREADAAALTAAALPVVDEVGVAPGEWVSIYESTPVEPPTHALVDALRARGIRVMVPITLPDLDLDWAEAGSAEPLGRDAIGWARVVFVPALSVDHRGTRMGQGGGCYDRVLPRAGQARVVALVHPWEVRDEELPREPHDLPVPEVMTAEGPPRSLGGAGGEH
jgi:5-formyltetrahydrofolate cyclo-ligase